MAGLATPMALRVAVTLGLPDRLRDTSATTEDLASELDVSTIGLDLLLDHLVTLEILDRTPTGWRTTDFGTNLCADADGGWTKLMLDLNSAAGRSELAFVELAHSVRTGAAAYPHRYGQDFWTDANEQPHLRETFDRQMTHRINAQIPGIVAGTDWSRFPTIVDVGGGPGSILAAILTAHPNVRGNLVDFPPTAAQARRTFEAQGLADRAEATAGSFFDPLPPGADAYLLIDILHDWDDENAHRILDRCVEAAKPTGRVLVVELVGDLGAQSEFNLAMLVLYGGRERKLDEFRALAAPHGLVLDEVTRLDGERSLLEFRLDQ